MIREGKYAVVKDIPLDKEGNHAIKAGNEISLTNGVFYLNGGMLPPDYQEDFRNLLIIEATKGWRYLVPDNPVIGKSII